jgi:hypothetical protein
MDLMEMIVAKWCNQEVILRKIEDFRRYLKLIYGSVYSAWNTVLDPDQAGEMFRVDMDAACAALGIKDVHRIMRMMQGGDEDRTITLLELCKQTSISVDNFMKQCKKYNEEGTWEAWSLAIPELFDGNDACTKEQFNNFCKKIGYPFGRSYGKGPGFAKPPQLFDLLLPAVGSTYLRYEDIFPPKPDVARSLSPRSPLRIEMEKREAMAETQDDAALAPETEIDAVADQELEAATKESPVMEAPAPAEISVAQQEEEQRQQDSDEKVAEPES